MQKMKAGGYGTTRTSSGLELPYRRSSSDDTAAPVFGLGSVVSAQHVLPMAPQEPCG